ncbi:MAG: exodeoxyribonuclease VII small subunit [Proteobacteria bacterium]|nr:exodeoxyribonuclease VII small subunit [Pseudomonadota bacterium]
MSKQTFEQAMKKLEQIVLDLESGELPLEKAVNKFEEGVQLSKFCFEKLDQTEKKITVLLQDQTGKIVEKPFTTENETADE